MTPPAKHPVLPLMGHLVVGYPTLADSFAAADAYAQAGFRYLELQLPFSHPTADGSALTEANRAAVANGTTMADAVGLLRRLRDAHPQARLVPMSYANKLFGYGLVRLADDLRPLGIDQIIIPDLPFDSAEADELRHLGLAPVPVVAANLSPARLEALAAYAPRFVYLMAGYKLTGQAFSLDPRVAEVVARLKASIPNVEVGIGFGITSAAQARTVLSVADVAIIGSALVAAQAAGRLPELLHDLATLHHAAPAA